MESWLLWGLAVACALVASMDLGDGALPRDTTRKTEVGKMWSDGAVVPSSAACRVGVSQRLPQDV